MYAANRGINQHLEIVSNEARKARKMKRGLDKAAPSGGRETGVSRLVGTFYKWL
jgi:hypothetical protein